MEINEVIESESNSDDEFEILDILKFFAPGTSMRTALDDILRARMGALIVVEKEGLWNIVEGGFRINSKFSPQKIVELAKMDGAIILSKDMKKILYANTLLVPKISLKTSETGTRHKAAERTAIQLGAIVVAVSERKNKITLYWKNKKQVLEGSSEILRRATETLQILEKQKELFDDSLINLNILEITNLVNVSDVCNVLQRLEIINRISESVRKYLIELGKEGNIVSMRLKELTKNLNYERDLILKDYFGSRSPKIKTALNNMNFDFLLEISNISRILFEELHDTSVSPYGFRILGKTNLLEKDIKLLINSFTTLDKIFNSTKDSLLTVIQNENFVNSIINSLDNLKEKIMSGKKI